YVVLSAGSAGSFSVMVFFLAVISAFFPREGVMMSCSLALLTLTYSLKVSVIVCDLKLVCLLTGTDDIRTGGMVSFGPPCGMVCLAHESARSKMNIER